MCSSTFSSGKLSVSGRSLLKKRSGSGVWLDLAGKPGKGCLFNFGLHGAILETGDLLAEPQVALALGSVAVLGDYDVGDALRIGSVRVHVVPVLSLDVDVIPVDEHNDICVLLDAAAFPQVGEHGLVAGALL